MEKENEKTMDKLEAKYEGMTLERNYEKEKSS